MFVKSVHLHQPSCTSLVVLPLKHNSGGGQGGRNPGVMGVGILQEVGEERAGDGTPKGAGEL